MPANEFAAVQGARAKVAPELELGLGGELPQSAAALGFQVAGAAHRFNSPSLESVPISIIESLKIGKSRPRRLLGGTRYCGWSPEACGRGPT